MSEIAQESPYSLDDFQACVAMTRNDPVTPDWQRTYAEYIRGEMLEAFFQHGPGLLLLSSPSFDVQKYIEKPAELQDEVQEEFGDMLWFGFAVANQYGIHARDACERSFMRHTDEVVSVASFTDLQRLAAHHAGKISVPNKFGTTTSLEDNPHYALTRIVNRLTRTMDPHAPASRIPTATESEAVVPLPNALGDYLNATAFVISSCTGWDLEDAALFNIQKLTERQAWGKTAGSA
jgi:hypothetical protein